MTSLTSDLPCPQPGVLFPDFAPVLRDRKRLSCVPPARAGALVALDAVVRAGVDVQAALDDSLSHASLSRQDAALCTELVYGYLRSEIRLSWLVRRFLKAPSKLPPGVLALLCLAAYELTQCDRVPAYATLDWAVSAVRALYGTGVSRLANAVLRNVDRLGDAWRVADFYACVADNRDRLCVRHSAPRWLVDLWCDGYSEEKATALLEASLLHPAPGLRINLARADGADCLQQLLSGNAGTGRQASGKAGVVFTSGGTPSEVTSLVSEGRASRQSGASQSALAALEPEVWPGPVWDCCCGRGGKTAALVETGVAVVAASDPSMSRLRGLRRDFARLGLPVPLAVRASAVRPPFSCAASTARAGSCGDGGSPLAIDGIEVEVSRGQSATGLVNASGLGSGGLFGTILVDAPCSGLGTLSRRPDIKRKRTTAQIAELVALQEAILDAVWPCLRSDGVLAYITCTRNPQENELRIAAFLERHPDARLEIAYETPLEDVSREFFYAARLRKA